MIDHVRKEVLHLLEQLGEACPEYRFGHIIANLVMLARLTPSASLWDIDDEEFLTAARKHLSDWNERHASVA